MLRSGVPVETPERRADRRFPWCRCMRWRFGQQGCDIVVRLHPDAWSNPYALERRASAKVARDTVKYIIRPYT